MNTVILALSDGSVRNFLTEKTPPEGKRLEFAQIFDPLACDIEFFENSTPNAVMLACYECKEGDLFFNEEKFIQLMFAQDETKIINRMYTMNEMNVEVAEQRQDRLMLDLFKKNREFLKNIKAEEVYSKVGKINHFFNIAAFKVTDPGKGYSKPIKIKISPPKSTGTPEFENLFGTLGKPVEFSIAQNKDSLQSIHVDKWGCGYVETPTIEISNPDDPNGRKPTITPVPMNLYFHD